MTEERKKLFEKLYSVDIEYQRNEQVLKELGIYIEESDLAQCYLAVFEIALDLILTEEGQEIFFENIYLQDWEIEDAMEELNDYFL